MGARSTDDPMVLRVVRGEADTEELAALSVVLLAVARHLAALPPAPPVQRAGWRRTHHPTGSWRVA
jgi:hypothetical protein